jgi:hypothetical protein
LRKSHWPVVALAISLAAPLAAQTPAKPDAAAEAAAAMERAKRQAAGPMRIILEASKARRKPGESEAGAPAAAPPAAASSDLNSVKAVANRQAAPATGANPPAGNAASPPANPIASPAGATAAPVAPPLVPATSSDASAARAAASTEGVVTQVTLDAGALGSKSPTAAVSGLESSTVVGPIVAPLPVAPQATVLQMQASDRVRLLSMVEPELPQRILEEMGRNATVLVDLRLRADGSVASVELASPAPRGMLRLLAPTLEQWKFAPLTSQRTHRIELLFNVER